MKRQFLLLPLVLLFPPACSDQTPLEPDLSPRFASAESSWEEGVLVDFTIDAFVSCVGEDIRFTGQVWYRWHFVTNANKEIWPARCGPMEGFRGEGGESGDLWLMKRSMLHGNSQTETWIASLGEPFQVTHVNNPRWDFINQATGQVLSWPFRFHLTRNAAGEVQASHYVEACRLKRGEM